MFLLIKKKNNIAIETTTIFNPSNFSSDFNFGHFAGIEDIPQSCMLIFLPRIKYWAF